jgi:hypothetical protein
LDLIIVGIGVVFLTALWHQGFAKEVSGFVVFLLVATLGIAAVEAIVLTLEVPWLSHHPLAVGAMAFLGVLLGWTLLPGSLATTSSDRRHDSPRRRQPTRGPGAVYRFPRR